MPVKHRKYLSYNADEFIRWPQTVGSYAASVVEKFLASGREPEPGYKSCASLTKLCDKYGIDRMEKACERVLSYNSQPSIRNIGTILKNGQDRVQPSQKAAVTFKTKSHGVTRGAAYFRKGGGQ